MALNGSFRLWRPASIVASSGMFVLLVTFARGVILAQLLGPHQYGLAILIVTVAGGLDILGDGGIDQLVVQSKVGTLREIRAAAQLYRIAGATVAAGLLFVLAHPLCVLLKAPEIALALQCLGPIAILRATVNLGYKLPQRSGAYGAEARIDVARYAMELAALVIGALVLGNFWAAVAGLATNAVTQVAVANALYGEPWRGRISRRAGRLVGRFALPITANAILLFAAMQGDRLIVGGGLSPERLAIYVACGAFGMAGTALAARLTTALSLFHFGAGRLKRGEVKHQARQLHHAFIAGSTLVGVGLAVVVPWLVPLAYGAEFAGHVSLIIGFACVNALQIEQGLLTALLTSAGQTRIFPALTLVRSLALPIAAWALASGAGLLGVAFAVFAGTALALATSARSAYRHGLLSRMNTSLSAFRSLVLAGVFLAIIAQAHG